MTQNSELIEKTIESLKQIQIKSQSSAQEEDGEYQYTIPEGLMLEIEDIVNKVDKFKTWEDFVAREYGVQKNDMNQNHIHKDFPEAPSPCNQA